MVKICDILNYSHENDSKYKEYFEKYPYELSIFQKYAIEGIIEGNNVLITAHTGSGKTLAAEFAIEYFVSKGKKVIYTAPIKALVNQKFYDFTHKYPHISFGVLSGDIKSNPEASVLIVTAEILLNKLYQNNSNSQISNSSTNFEMNIEDELACVVMDEVHYINEYERGTVWENTFMLLPSHVQLVMLSATIDKPEKFAHWCENIHKDSKQVYLTNTTHRVVPLTHYSFITVNNGIFKAIKDKSVHEEIKSIIDKPFVIQDSKGNFDELHYLKMNKMLKLFEKNEVRVKRTHVLNQVTKYLVENEMLPALCFVLSRKQLEVCANEISTPLLEFDSKVPYIIDRECEQIIRKLPNYQEYLHLPEYTNMVSLLRKGIAIHHSGVMPVLKEMVELLYAKGYIKLLFATETFSIGVNMPTKCVMFTDVNKFDGNNNRLLFAHEMTQMSGRAGRRGIDKIGHVIHLNNLFRNVDLTSYKTMMNGKPQTLTSKFKISFNLLLNLIDTNTDNINFANKSMIKGDIDNQLKEVHKNIEKIQTEIDKMNESIKHLRTPIEIVKEYIECIEKRPNTVNKKRKEVDRQIQNIVDNYKFIESEKLIIIKYNEKQFELQALQKECNNVEKYIDNNVLTIINLLERDGFVSEANVSEANVSEANVSEANVSEANVSEANVSEANVSEALETKQIKYELSQKGHIATHLREVHCLVFAHLIDKEMLDNLTSRQLVSIFSCFTNVSVQDELKAILPQSDNKIIQNMMIKIQEMYNEYQQKEVDNKINTGTEYNIHFDLLDYVIKWCDCDSIEDCKFLLQTLEKEKGIFLGEFVKALLKINNISSEMEKIAELTGNIQFLSKLKEIPIMTLKYVVTNQSLYV
jgi:superfamily II RNA helicase